MGLFSISKVFSQIFSEIWKWAILADRERFLAIYTRTLHPETTKEKEPCSIIQNMEGEKRIANEVYEKCEISRVSDLETIPEDPQEESSTHQDISNTRQQRRNRRKCRVVISEEIVIPEPSLQQKLIVEKVLKLIENEIKATRPYPKQRQSYLRLEPVISDLFLAAYISSQAWEKYKVRIIWGKNMDITIDLYPDY